MAHFILWVIQEQKVVFEADSKYKSRTKFLGLNMIPWIQKIIQVTSFTRHKTKVSTDLFVGVKCGLLNCQHTHCVF